ncbi:MAG TPA: glycine dehydrogenase, partial [Ilumatobacteraceae bacterium]|nr:glycine dehydrogenase [Ilumatobacteraceae bacterium]
MRTQLDDLNSHDSTAHDLSLDDLIDAGEFTRRHTSPTTDERQHMLGVIGEDSIESLLAHTVPEVIRMTEDLHLDEPRSPQSVHHQLRDLAAKNVHRTSLIGMGYYGTIAPPVIVRNVLENPAWYTAYTPYQPEISQGRLEALLNFQTMVAELTGFDLANASLLDEATAAAEAMTMARRLSKSDSDRFVVHHDTHPQTIAVLATRAEPVGIELVVGDVDEIAGGCFGALFSLPTSSGAIIDWSDAIASVHEVQGLAIVATDLLACMLTVPPAQLGADIAIGSAQRFGVSMGFGGPHAAFIAAEESVARALPGRLVGVSTDTEGRPAMRLALQTREQHIRREKATSNICTAQVLLANIAGFYAAWHGPEGLRRIAERVHRLASIAAAALRTAGLDLVNDTWFDTVQVRCDARSVIDRAADVGLDLRFVDDSTVGFSLDETSTLETLTTLLAAFDIAADIATIEHDDV